MRLPDLAVKEAIALGLESAGGKELVSAGISSVLRFLSETGLTSSNAPLVRKSASEIEELLSTRPVTFVDIGARPDALRAYLEESAGAKRKLQDFSIASSRASSIRIGHVSDDANKLVRIFAKPRSPDGLDDVLAYQLHKMSSFESSFPVTVTRNDFKDMFIQERVGKSLFHRGSTMSQKWIRPGNANDWYDSVGELVRAMYESDSLFRNQMQQAVLERGFFGIHDGEGLANFALSRRGGISTVAPIDAQKVFESGYYPSGASVPTFLRGSPIADSNLAKVSATVRTFESDKGREALGRLGVSDNHALQMLSRGNWFLRSKKFPGESN